MATLQRLLAPRHIALVGGQWADAAAAATIPGDSGCGRGTPLLQEGFNAVGQYALEKYGLRRGIASLCIGGGEATAVAIERIA